MNLNQNSKFVYENNKIHNMFCAHRYAFILSFAFFHMVIIAQLLTINWDEHNGSAYSAELIDILESIKQLREEYEFRTREFSNSIGL